MPMSDLRFVVLRRTTPAWLAVAALLAAPRSAHAQVAAGTQTHTVSRGDTLWDLARRYLSDPFLWPEIFKRNTDVVEDPHWIYPGEVLTIAGGPATPAVPQTDTPAPVETAARPVPANGAEPASGGAAETADTAPAAPAAMDEASADVDSDEPVFPRLGGTVRGSVLHFTPRSYKALRPSEFFSADFLTERRPPETGTLLGPVTPPQIESQGFNATTGMYGIVAVEMNKGARRPEVGDTLATFYYGKELGEFGKVVVPTGLVRITSLEGGRTLGKVIALYGPMRGGQLVMPAGKFVDGGEQRAVPVADGIAAKVVGWPAYMELKDPLDVLFLDKGSRDGVKPGDVFELRRVPGDGHDALAQAPELLAVVSVVRTGEKHSTAKVVKVVIPKIATGTAARQIARLPS